MPQGLRPAAFLPPPHRCGFLLKLLRWPPGSRVSSLHSPCSQALEAVGKGVLQLRVLGLSCQAGTDMSGVTFRGLECESRGRDGIRSSAWGRHPWHVPSCVSLQSLADPMSQDPCAVAFILRKHCGGGWAFSGKSPAPYVLPCGPARQKPPRDGPSAGLGGFPASAWQPAAGCPVMGTVPGGGGGSTGCDCSIPVPLSLRDEKLPITAKCRRSISLWAGI